MKRLIVGLALIFGIACQASTNAVITIDGAFGLKLGDEFDPAKATDTSETTAGEPLYGFKPEKPVTFFQRYYVQITPTTRRIYCIWAIGRSQEMEKAKAEHAALLEILSGKYGPASKPGFFDTMGDARRIEQGGREVMLKINGLSSGELDVRYTDEALRKVAKDEFQKIVTDKAKQQDVSGL